MVPVLFGGTMLGLGLILAGMSGSLMQFALAHGVLAGFLKYFLCCLTSYDVLASTRRVYLRAFQHLCHGLASLISFHDEHYLTVDEEAMPFLSIKS